MLLLLIDGLSVFHTLLTIDPTSNHAPAAVRSTPVTQSLDYHDVWLTSVSRKFVVFLVRACRDAHIRLSRFYGSRGGDVFEVRIGAINNTRTEVQGPFLDGPIRSVATPDVLSCNEARPFWISWSDTHVRVGSGGQVGGNELVEQDFQNFSIHSLTFSTSIEVNGTWEFPEYNGTHVLPV